MRRCAIRLAKRARMECGSGRRGRESERRRRRANWERRTRQQSWTTCGVATLRSRKPRVVGAQLRGLAPSPPVVRCHPLSLFFHGYTSCVLLSCAVWSRVRAVAAAGPPMVVAVPSVVMVAGSGDDGSGADPAVSAAPVPARRRVRPPLRMSPPRVAFPAAFQRLVSRRVRAAASPGLDGAPASPTPAVTGGLGHCRAFFRLRACDRIGGARARAAGVRDYRKRGLYRLPGVALLRRR
jgi:hypothetical protein